MSTDRIYIVGAGGHCKVVLDALLSCGVERSVLNVSDRNPSLAGTQILGISIQTPDICDDLKAQSFHIAIGDNRTRERLFGQMIEKQVAARSIIHPTATISRYAMIRDGAFIAAHAVLAPEVSLGLGCIINHGAVVDHDSIVGPFSLIAPNATLGGKVRIGARVLIGAGANILPGISIGDDAIIGAGSVVTRDVGAGETRKGIPAVRTSTS